MRRQLVIFICALAAFCALAFAFIARNPDLASAGTVVGLRGVSIRAAVAATEVARQRGLSGVTHLAEDEGMLFVFDHDEKWSFWMKDMQIAIDIVWLSADKHVVYMAQNVAPTSYPSVFIPDVPARYVLELPAGWVARHSLITGDMVEF